MTEHHWHPQAQKNQKIQTIQTIQKPKLVENMLEIKNLETRKTQIDKHPERQGQRGLSPKPLYYTIHADHLCRLYHYNPL